MLCRERLQSAVERSLQDVEVDQEIVLKKKMSIGSDKSVSFEDKINILHSDLSQVDKDANNLRQKYAFF